MTGTLLKGKTYEQIYGYEKAQQLKLLHSLSHKGKIAWNKGLTKETDERICKYGAKVSISNTGKKRSLEVRKKMSLQKMGDKNPMKREDVKLKARKPHILTIEGRMKKLDSFLKNRNINHWKNYKHGFRKDLNCWFRSSWEANVARILTYLKIPWEFEKYKFLLSNNVIYIPDFKVGDKLFIEVKGWWTEKDAKKVNLFQNESGNDLIVVDVNMYKDLKKMYGDKIAWEN